MANITLKERALALLCEPVQKGPAGETIGRPYDEIYAILKHEFPEHRWNSNLALYWYAYKIRDGEFEGYELPDGRPPARWAQGGKDR